MDSDELNTVLEWHSALNGADHKKLSALVHDDVQIAGPRGLAHGRDILLEWLDRAAVKLYPQRYFQEGATVVVEERGEWPDLETGEISSQVVASVFRVERGRISYIARYPSLDEALQASGLSLPDEKHPDIQ